MAVYDCTTEAGLDEGIEMAADAVREGRVVVLPTDTVYGIGCDAFSADAVSTVLEAKGRGRDMPPPVLVPSARTVDGLAIDIPTWARDLMAEFWPGALTLVLRSHTSLMWDLGDTNGTVALRMPQDDIALRLLTEVGPMAVTSANRTGSPAATTMTEAAAQLGASVDIYLEGGPRDSSLASTIVDCTGEEVVILREGAIPAEAVNVVVDRSRAEAAAAEAAAAEAAAAEAAETDEPAGDDPDAPDDAVAPDEPDDVVAPDAPDDAVAHDAPDDTTATEPEAPRPAP